MTYEEAQQLLQERLTATAVEDWLKTLPPTDLAGYSYQSCGCMVARFCEQVLHIPFPDVDYDRKGHVRFYHYDFGNDDSGRTPQGDLLGVQEIPEKQLSRAMQLFDLMSFEGEVIEVTVAEALECFARAREEIHE